MLNRSHFYVVILEIGLWPNGVEKSAVAQDLVLRFPLPEG